VALMQTPDPRKLPASRPVPPLQKNAIDPRRITPRKEPAHDRR